MLLKIILFAGAAVSGFGSATLMVAQGEYSALCATKKTEGFYFGYFWLWYMASQSAGPIIGSYLITKVTGPIFYLVMGGFSTVCLFFIICCLMGDPIVVEEQEEEEEMTFCESL